MSRTVDSLKAFLDKRQPITPGAKADYGFDVMSYEPRGVPIPNTSQIVGLMTRISVLLQEEGGADKLHQSVVDKTYLSLLQKDGKDYSWVKTCWMAFDEKEASDDVLTKAAAR